MDLLG